LEFAPSTYYAGKSRKRSDRDLRHDDLKLKIKQVFEESGSRYGVRKVHLELLRQDVVVGRDQVARLMKELGLKGITAPKKKKVVTTVSNINDKRPLDLLNRDFYSDAPNKKWVADITYVLVNKTFLYVAFVIDVYSRMIVGWNISRSLKTNLPLQALEMAISLRDISDDLIHHSDRGSQYLSLTYSERLEEAGITASVGSKGDSYDNALAEATNNLYKREVVFHEGPFSTASELEKATASWVLWFNTKRLHSACGYIPPLEFEKNYYTGIKKGKEVA
jgi:transposase InsO family protein